MPPELRNYLPSDVSDFLQIFVIWVALYFALRLVRGTIAGSILRGAVLLVAFAVVVTAVVLRAFHLRVLEEILKALGNVAVIASLVVFQPELRRGLLSVGEHRFFSRFRARAPGCVDELCAAAAKLSAERKGALFAIERRILLHHIAATGVPVDAEARADTMLTIFWPGSPLHDGGAVLRGDRIVAARCIFPLTERRELASEMGTRHRAALGMSEESDAVIVVVSEETGKISIALQGELRHVTPSELRGTLLDLLGPPDAAPAGPRLGERAAAAVAAEDAR
jgi:diadenylate cyclase